MITACALRDGEDPRRVCGLHPVMQFRTLSSCARPRLSHVLHHFYQFRRFTKSPGLFCRATWQVRGRAKSRAFCERVAFTEVSCATEVSPRPRCHVQLYFHRIGSESGDRSIGRSTIGTIRHDESQVHCTFPRRSENESLLFRASFTPCGSSGPLERDAVDHRVADCCLHVKIVHDLASP